MQTQERFDDSVIRDTPQILVVEDERIAAQDLSDTLAELGYSVIGTVASGEDAIAAARQRAPNLVIMDIELSGVLDGVQAAEQILLEGAVPTVYLTVHADDKTLRRAASTELYGFVVKPFKAPELRCAIELALHASKLSARRRQQQRWMTSALEEQARKIGAHAELQKVKSAGQLESTNAELAGVLQAAAHGLRAPVRRLNGSCRALAETHAEWLGPDRIDYLDRIRKTSDRCVRVIDGLDRLARITQSPFNPEPVDLSRLALAVTKELQLAHPERSVEVTIQNEVWIRGDCKQLQILLENLLDNAWKFTARTARAKIEFSASTGNAPRVCSIRDNGVGFDIGEGQNLFGLFERLHALDEFDGTGVGLAVVQRVVHRHGGWIWAQSAAGRGATFHFTL